MPAAEFHRLCGFLIFGGVYLLLAGAGRAPRKLDRPAIALAGAVLMVATGALTRHQAADALDLSTLALLFGMMVVVHFVSSSGILRQIASSVLARGHSPAALLWMVCVSAGVLSALFVNDPVCLLMTPLVLDVAEEAGLRPKPYLLALATGSNTGSMMTLTGNPQNMLIGASSHISWAAYAAVMAPIGLICLAACAAVLNAVYRGKLNAAEPQARSSETAAPIINRRLSQRTLVVSSALLVALTAGVPMDVAALSAAVVILVWANRPPEETFANIDWSLLLFFAGLFVVVRGFTLAGNRLLTAMLPIMAQHTAGVMGAIKFTVASVALSNLLSNVPFVMLVRGLIGGLPNARLYWLLLAAGSTLAGNLTLLGSVANLIVAGSARKRCKLTFWDFAAVGVPVTAVTCAISVLALLGLSRLGAL